jgi:Tfp pilus assembly protein PilF
MIAAVPLMVQIAACAAPGARAQRSDSGAVAKQKDASAAPATAQDTKAFAAAVQGGDAAWQSGDLDRAVYYYVLAMERSPQDAPTLAKIGAIEEGRGNIAQAEKAFEMARTADPQEPRIAERLAGLYLRDQKIERAGQIYGEVLARNPQRSRSLDGMGEVCIARSDYLQSIRYFDQALQAENADAAAVLTHRGYAKLQSNDLPGAESDLRAALTLGPRADARRYLAELQVRRGDTGGALESMLKVMDAAQA